MKINEYIQELQALAILAPDTEITMTGYHGDVRSAKLPTIAYERICAKREYIVRYFDARLDKESQRGRKVIKL